MMMAAMNHSSRCCGCHAAVHDFVPVLCGDQLEGCQQRPANVVKPGVWHSRLADLSRQEQCTMLLTAAPNRSESTAAAYELLAANRQAHKHV
jgi:hypothetical protein